MDRVGILPRLAAFLIDLGIFAAAVHLFFAVDLFLNLFTNLNNLGVVSLLGGALLLIGYGLAEVLMAGTPGKRLAGLIIAGEDGQPAARKALFKRWGVKQLPVFFAAPAVICWTLISPHNIHLPLPDYIALAVKVLAIIDTILTVMLLIMVAGGCFLAMGPLRQTLHDRIARTALFRHGELYTSRAFSAVISGDPKGTRPDVSEVIPVAQRHDHTSG